jgi:hypothetical protein
MGFEIRCNLCTQSTVEETTEGALHWLTTHREVDHGVKPIPFTRENAGAMPRVDVVDEGHE